MKYFLLFLVAAGSYIYYERSQAWNDNDLAELVMEKSEELCVMPELLEQYSISTKQCASNFTRNIDTCLVEAEQKYPGKEFESKAQILKAFNETLNCIIVKMEK